MVSLRNLLSFVMCRGRSPALRPRHLSILKARVLRARRGLTRLLERHDAALCEQREHLQKHFSSDHGVAERAMAFDDLDRKALRDRLELCWFVPRWP